MLDSVVSTVNTDKLFNASNLMKSLIRHQLLALQRNFATNPETFLRQLQSAGPRGDLSLMAASFTGLSGLAAGLGLPLPQFGFGPSDGLAKSENRFVHNKRVVSNEDSEDADDKVPEKFGANVEEIFGAKRRKQNEELEMNGGKESPVTFKTKQSK